MARKQNKVLKELFSITVSNNGDVVKQSFEVDKNTHRITGIAISSNRDDLLYYRGSQLIRINDEEFFPEGYESKRLMCGQNIVPHLRYYRLGSVDPGNRKIDLAFTDTDNPSVAPFEPYTVILYVFSTLADD